MPSNRPCPKCGYVVPSKAASHFRKMGLKSVKCIECGTSVNLYGKPCRKQDKNVDSARP
jgi:hypothetical protein